MSIIILSKEDDGSPRQDPQALADDILDLAPDETVRFVKGPISGVEVSDKAAVLWLMARYTASGNPRKGK